MNVGDEVLLRQRKTTTKPPFDPEPYTAVKVDGNRVHANRHDKRRIRDKNDIKVVKERPAHLTPQWELRSTERKSANYKDFDIEADWNVLNRTRNTRNTSINVDTISQQTEEDEPNSVESIPHNGAIESADNTSRCEALISLNSMSEATASLSLSHNGGQMGGGAISSGDFCAICQNQLAPFQGGGLCNNCSTGLRGNSGHCVDDLSPSTQPSTSHAPETKGYRTMKPPDLKKGDIVRFKGKEDNDEWFVCTLSSRAGTAKGKYSRAWNIVRDGIAENIDFERDVGAYEIATQKAISEGEADGADIHSATDIIVTEEPVDMESHLRALLEAAERREEEN